MMIVGSEPGPVFLFVRDPDESADLRGAVGTCVGEVRAFGLDAIGLRTACAIIRATGVAPSVLLFEQEHRDASARESLAALRGLPELSSLRVFVIGDGEDPEAEQWSRDDGADGFIALPKDASDSPRFGQDVVHCLSGPPFSMS
jgi:hypothetical protein